MTAGRIPDELAVIRERHVPIRPAPGERCAVCLTETWPCDTARVLAEVDRLRADIERAVRVLSAFRSAYTLGEANALRVVDLLQTDAEDLAADLRAVLAGGA